MTTVAQNRLHRATSALAFKLLADGKVAAFDYACAHQAPHWIDTALTPEQALAKSLDGFVQPATDRRISPKERADAAHAVAYLSSPAPWDEAAMKAEQEAVI